MGERNAQCDDFAGWLTQCDETSRSRFGEDARYLVADSDKAEGILREGFSNDKSPAQVLVELRQAQAKELWSDLGDIPVTDNDELDAVFLDFPKGSDLMDVWYWFEETYNVSIANDLMPAAV